MTLHAEALRLRLAAGPKSGSQMAKEIGLSQPTVTRALAAMGDDVIKTGQKKSTRYLLRDKSRGFGEVPVYRVDAQGKVSALGTLAPVRPEGFVFTQADGVHIHSELQLQAPRFVEAIARGQGPIGLSFEFFVRKVLPHDWGQQEDVMEALAR